MHLFSKHMSFSIVLHDSKQESFQFRQWFIVYKVLSLYTMLLVLMSLPRCKTGQSTWGFKSSSVALPFHPAPYMSFLFCLPSVPLLANVLRLSSGLPPPWSLSPTNLVEVTSFFHWTLITESNFHGKFYKIHSIEKNSQNTWLYSYKTLL